MPIRWIALAQLAAMGGLLAVAACTLDEMPGPQSGSALFLENCAACHGYDGTSDAPLVGGQAPPDLTRLAAANGGEFPTVRVLSQIDGYGRGKVPAEVMPEFGLLLEGELVPVDTGDVLTPTPRPLAALLAYLQSIQVD